VNLLGPVEFNMSRVGRLSRSGEEAEGLDSRRELSGVESFKLIFTKIV
jgi:hypothetical protein